jgi:hypothetical protein
MQGLIPTIRIKIMGSADVCLLMQGLIPYKLAYKSPLCGPCGRNEGFLGGLISKGDLYASCIVR